MCLGLRLIPVKLHKVMSSEPYRDIGNNSLQPTPRTARFGIDGSGMGILKSKPEYERGG